MHSTVSATIIWCSSCATVGTGTQETGENADIWATVTAASNTLSFVSKKKKYSQMGIINTIAHFNISPFCWQGC